MAKGKRSASTRSILRGARNRLGDLLAQQSKLERSRPRTPGKKAAKTRALNKLARQIPAAKGLVTKARKAVAAIGQVATATDAARQKRSEAAKRGWQTRRARRATILSDGAKFMPMLTNDGVVWVNPVGGDRNLLGSYWSVVAGGIDNRSAFSLSLFNGLSVFDGETDQRLPFITDVDTILAYHDHYDFGPSFYKTRGEVPRFAL
jgi:hypothetical protein